MIEESALNSAASNSAQTPARIGVVAIGRNEGERFERCVLSLKREAASRPLTIVYVDSGSTDNSVAFAKSHGVEVVNLDMSRPFTAARARNAGLERLLEVSPRTEFVQFIDGDCEVIEGWLAAGADALASDANVVAVSGRLRERFPERTLYNRLADLEWERPVGETKSCGGVAMMRVEAVRRAGGFDAALIAGEEPELCARMRAQGGRILNIAHEMAWHDMAMTTSGQWFKRARRHGHAIVEVSYFKTAASRGLFKQQMRSAVVWGVVVLACVVLSILPIVSYIATYLLMRNMVTEPSFSSPRGAIYMIVFITYALTPVMLLLYFGLVFLWFLQVLRIGLKARKKSGLRLWDAIRYGRLMMISKEYQMRGMIDFLWRRWRKKDSTLISFKE